MLSRVQLESDNHFAGSILNVLLLISVSGTLPSFTMTSSGIDGTSMRIAAVDFPRTSRRFVASPDCIRTVTGDSAPAATRFSNEPDTTYPTVSTARDYTAAQRYSG